MRDSSFYICSFILQRYRTPLRSNLISFIAFIASTATKKKTCFGHQKTIIKKKKTEEEWRAAASTTTATVSSCKEAKESKGRQDKTSFKTEFHRLRNSFKLATLYGEMPWIAIIILSWVFGYLFGFCAKEHWRSVDVDAFGWIKVLGGRQHKQTNKQKQLLLSDDASTTAAAVAASRVVCYVKT